MTELEKEALEILLDYNKRWDIDVFSVIDDTIIERDALTTKIDAIREWICVEYWRIINKLDHPEIIIAEINHIYCIGEEIPYYVTEAEILRSIYCKHFGKGWR